MENSRELLMKNILYYENSSGFGGSSSNLFHILRQLDQSKYHPLVVVHNAGPQFERMQSAGIRIVKIPFDQLEEINKSGSIKLIMLFVFSVGPLVVKFINLIKKEKIDVVHINTNILLGMPMIIAAKLMGKKTICYIRESRPLIQRERMLVRWIDELIILNHEAIGIYSRDIPEHKLNVVYDGVDLTEFENIDSDGIRAEFSLDGAPVVGIVGRIVRGKGYLEFVKAAELVVQRISDVRFVIVGAAKSEEDEQYLKEVKDYVEEKDLGNKVIFTGWRTDVKQIMAALDVLVLATTTFPEGLPNTIIEAMALKKPTVVTNVPGPAEIVVNGKTGYIVPPGDVKQMAEKITDLLNERVLSDEFGKNGRRRVEELFDVRKVVAQFDQLYKGAESVG